LFICTSQVFFCFFVFAGHPRHMYFQVIYRHASCPRAAVLFGTLRWYSGD